MVTTLQLGAVQLSLRAHLSLPAFQADSFFIKEVA